MGLFKKTGEQNFIEQNKKRVMRQKFSTVFMGRF
jgi:hypothetical protein